LGKVRKCRKPARDGTGEGVKVGTTRVSGHVVCELKDTRKGRDTRGERYARYGECERYERQLIIPKSRRRRKEGQPEEESTRLQALAFWHVPSGTRRGHSPSGSRIRTLVFRHTFDFRHSPLGTCLQALAFRHSPSGTRRQALAFRHSPSGTRLQALAFRHSPSGTRLQALAFRRLPSGTSLRALTFSHSPPGLFIFFRRRPRRASRAQA
jgi:hypothetical protein